MSFGLSNFCCCFLLAFWLMPVQAQEIDKNIPPSLDKLEANAVDLKISDELAVREEDSVSKTPKSITVKSFEILGNSVFSQEELKEVTQPFLDIGTVWNNDDDLQISDDILPSVGLGLNFSASDRFLDRLDWGIPLVDVDTDKNSLQENGIYFSINYNFF